MSTVTGRLSLAFTLALCLFTLAAVVAFMSDTADADGGTIRYVATTGIDAGGCTDPDNHCRTVQYAVDQATSGDTIKIATGVYSAVYVNKTVTIRGGYTAPDFTDPPDPEANPTTLDGEQQGRVLQIHSFTSELISPTVEGLRITGGYAEKGAGVYIDRASPTIRFNQVFSNTAGEYGGGIYVVVASPTIRFNQVFSNTAGQVGGGVSLIESTGTLVGNTISGNSATGGGGGLDLWCSDATLTDNTISDNSTMNGTGGGLLLLGSDATLNRNTISGNTAHYEGGGLALEGGEPTLTGNTISGNSANAGGGLWLDDCDANLTNNIIADNQSNSNGSGLYMIAGTLLRLVHTTIARNSGDGTAGVYVFGYGPCTLAMTNTILVSNTVGIYVSSGCTATLEGTLWGTGAWANDVDWDGTGTIITGTVNYWGDPAFRHPDLRDYHITESSVAIDVGIDAGVTADIDGQFRPYDGGYDMGADEFHPYYHFFLPLILRSAL